MAFYKINVRTADQANTSFRCTILMTEAERLRSLFICSQMWAMCSTARYWENWPALEKLKELDPDMNEKIASFEMTMNHLFLVSISCHEKYDKPGWLKQHTFIPHSSGTQEVKVRLLADLFPGQSFVSGSQTSTIHYVLMWQLERVLVFLHLMRKNPHLHDLIQTEPPSRAPSPNPPHWELKLQHMNLGVTKTFTQSIRESRFVPFSIKFDKSDGKTLLLFWHRWLDIFSSYISSQVTNYNLAIPWQRGQMINWYVLLNIGALTFDCLKKLTLWFLLIWDSLGLPHPWTARNHCMICHNPAWNTKDLVKYLGDPELSYRTFNKHGLSLSSSFVIKGYAKNISQ